MLHFLLILFVSILSVGCISNGAPRYQASEGAGRWAEGYKEYEIDSSTFLVTYMLSRRTPSSQDPRESKYLIRLVQDFALFRAAELARSKGVQWFQILQRDDWLAVGSKISAKSTSGPIIQPGAAILIRMLRNRPEEATADTFRAGALLKSLTAGNSSLALHQGHAVEPSKDELSKAQFSRWRTSIFKLEPVPLTSEGLGISLSVPETKVTKVSATRFEIERWGYSYHPSLQSEFLGECVKVAEREEADVFTVTDWKVEEFGAGHWFRTKATVLLNLDIPGEPVFHTREIKPNVDTDTLKRRQQAERDKVIDRDLESGLVY